MKTDSLFYELFKIDPQSLFELAQVNVPGNYVFESITVKTTEKRLDGFFKRVDGEGPNAFLEVQGYPDPLIYWRQLREISTYYEQTGSDRPFLAIVLFLDKKYQPENDCPCQPNSPNQMVICTLDEGLKAAGNQAGTLTVLKPLRLSSKKRLPALAPQWVTELRALKLTPGQTDKLLELLEYAILKRFPTLTTKEVEQLMQLTPLEQTVAGQELIQIGETRGMQRGRQEGHQEGRRVGRLEGKLIGKIHATQRFLKRPLTADRKLLNKSIKELRTILKQLEAELA